MTDIKFDEKWLREAVAAEDEADCDIHAGLELGQNLGEYVTNAKSYIDRQKLISVLKEGFEVVLVRGKLVKKRWQTLEKRSLFIIKFLQKAIAFKMTNY